MQKTKEKGKGKGKRKGRVVVGGGNDGGRW
jgi:hypothetical protein